MIFVAFVLPVACYLIFLGWVNRQPRPSFVSGPVDFVGLLFASSGFLIVGGPAALSAFNERWRQFWVLGEIGSLMEGLDAAREVWLWLAVGYYFVVVAGCGWLCWRRRDSTCIYNVDPGVTATALLEVCDRLDVAVTCAGERFVLGLETTLVVEEFAAMRHVTLRWSPVDAALRSAVEAELERWLGRRDVAENDTGAWLGLVGSGLLMLTLATLLALVVRRFLAGG